MYSCETCNQLRQAIAGKELRAHASIFVLQLAIYRRRNKLIQEWAAQQEYVGFVDMDAMSQDPHPPPGSACDHIASQVRRLRETWAAPGHLALMRSSVLADTMCTGSAGQSGSPTTMMHPVRTGTCRQRLKARLICKRRTYHAIRGLAYQWV